MGAVKTGIVVVAAGVLALAAGVATHTLLGTSTALRAELVSDDADVDSLFLTRLPDVNGLETPFDDITGKVTVVNFWATWCAPCRDEIPDFIKLQSEYRGRGVRFVGIAAEKPDKVPVFARELGINYTILIGEYAAMELARKLGDKAGALPFTVVIDANRKLLHRELGVLKPARLREIFAGRV